MVFDVFFKMFYWKMVEIEFEKIFEICKSKEKFNNELYVIFFSIILYLL